LPGGHAAHDRRRFTKLNGVFSDAGYISIGDPYLDGRTASGPPAGVCGSITSRTGEAKASFFPPRLYRSLGLPCCGLPLPPPPPAAASAWPVLAARRCGPASCLPRCLPVTERTLPRLRSPGRGTRGDDCEEGRHRCRHLAHAQPRHTAVPGAQQAAALNGAAQRPVGPLATPASCVHAQLTRQKCDPPFDLVRCGDGGSGLLLDTRLLLPRSWLAEKRLL
jgi:hypothetical protein